MMKKQTWLKILPAAAGAMICVFLFRDFDPALPGAVVCMALYVILGRKENHQQK